MRFALPFPPVSKLGLNARTHWAERARLVRSARFEACALTKQASRDAAIPDARPLPIKFIFHPPNKIRRDRDNMVAALKPYADGIADAIGVDDALWEPTYATGEPIKGGCVIVEIGGQS